MFLLVSFFFFYKISPCHLSIILLLKGTCDKGTCYWICQQHFTWYYHTNRWLLAWTLFCISEKTGTRNQSIPALVVVQTLWKRRAFQIIGMFNWISILTLRTKSPIVYEALRKAILWNVLAECEFTSSGLLCMIMAEVNGLFSLYLPNVLDNLLIIKTPA